MSKLVVLSLALSACATGGLTTIDRDTATHAKIQFQAAAVADGLRSAFPKAIEPALPSVDRLAYHIRARTADDLVAAVNLCVSPAGRVTKVSLVRASSFAPFDGALLRDLESWRFAELPGPQSLEVCNEATISYRPPR